MKSLRYLKGITILLISTCAIFAAVPNWDCDEDGVLDNYNSYANNGSITAAVYDDGLSIGSVGDIFSFRSGVKVEKFRSLFGTKKPAATNIRTAINVILILHCSAFGYIPYINLLNQTLM